MKKKLVAMLTVVAMVASMGLTAFAAESSTTVNNSAANTAADTIVAAATTAVATSADAATAVESIMTAPATPAFDATINALGSDIAINNMGTKKTVASAVDAFGNVIASAGKITGVTTESLVMLYAVCADGSVEVVEGVVDPATGWILGAFKNTPVTISVLVVVPASAK